MQCMDNIRLQLNWRSVQRINVAEVPATNSPNLFSSITSAHSDTSVKDGKENHK
jgi:hypothetical protein